MRARLAARLLDGRQRDGLQQRFRRRKVPVDGGQPARGKAPAQRQLAAEKTRTKLLAAALEAFANRPYADVTVSEIARSAGVAQGLLSHHFHGKEGLYAEVVREADARLHRAQDVGTSGPLAALLQRRFRAHVAFLAENEILAINLVLRRTGATETAWTAFESARLRGIRELCHLLGQAPEQPASLSALRAFASAADELTLTWLRSTRTCSPETLADALTELLSGALSAAARLAPTDNVDAAIAELRRHQPD
ncbi:TetR/AcrR family transcriptional regulator [Streptomyces tendae]|uniref:TetR/AcrR family transcriptional regulator n=1 Tax=Streptomyces tendae TaxID=1932 RepID=UPI0036C22981